MENYLNLKIGAKNRLAALKASAANGKWVNPMTWRNVRFATFKSSCELSRGLNNKRPVYYSFSQVFERQKFADEILQSGNRGYYSDIDCDSTIRGIVVKLPHGKFIAGYYWSDNGEYVYYPEIETDENDAARSADHYAEQYAELCREDSERFDAAQKLQFDISDSIKRLRECIKLRNVACMDYVRSEIIETIEKIKSMRDELATTYAGVL